MPNENHQPDQPLPFGCNYELGALVEELRSASAGRHEWRVQDPKDGSYCIAFSRNDGYSLDPEREARAWLAEQQALYPGSKKASYVVARVHVQTRSEQLMQHAANEIARLMRELDEQRLYARALCRAVDAATDFAGTVAGGASWWDDVWADHAAALDRARERISAASERA